MWEATYKVTSQSNSGEADSAEQQFFLKDVCRPKRVAMGPCFDACFLQQNIAHRFEFQWQLIYTLHSQMFLTFQMFLTTVSNVT